MLSFDEVADSAVAELSQRAPVPKKPPKPDVSAEKFSADDFQSPERLALYMSYLIDDISRIQGSVSDRLLKPMNVTRSQGWILHYVSWRPESTLTEIARALDVTKVAVGKIVDALVARGLVTVIADAADARAKRIRLTSEGKRLVKRFGHAGEELAASTICQFDKDEAAVILSFLLSMKARLIQARDSGPGAIEVLVDVE